MNNEILFTERQRFTQWWLWIILLGINGLLLYGIIRQIIDKQPFGDNPMSDTGLLITFGISLLLPLLFLCARLETHIKRDGIYVRFFPFHIQFKHYPWSLITKSYVRQYAAIKEYGGWGIRVGIFRKGKAYNVSGYNGLQLEISNKSKLLIGTNKPQQIIETLTKLGQLKH